MATEDEEDLTIYEVVVNHEEQYSIWPVDRAIPAGWKTVGVSGPKAKCLTHIQCVWTDMRPLSLRMRLEAARDCAPGNDSASFADAPNRRGSADKLT